MTTGINKFLGGKALGDLPAFPDAVTGGGLHIASGYSQISGRIEVGSGIVEFPAATGYTSTLVYRNKSGTSQWSVDGRNVGAGAGIDYWGPICIDDANDKVIGLVFNDASLDSTPEDLNYFERTLAGATNSNQSQHTGALTTLEGGQLMSQMALGKVSCHLDATNFTIYWNESSSSHDIKKLAVNRSTGVGTVTALQYSSNKHYNIHPTFVTQDESVIIEGLYDSNLALVLKVCRNGRFATVYLQEQLYRYSKMPNIYTTADGWALFIPDGNDHYVISSGVGNPNSTLYGGRRYKVTDVDQWAKDLAEKLGL